MAATATSQDIRKAVDSLGDKLSTQMVTKHDLQSVVAQIRNSLHSDVKGLHGENDAVIRSTQAQFDQINQRLTGLERNVQIVAHDLARLHDTLSKVNMAVGHQGESSSYTFQRI